MTIRRITSLFLMFIMLLTCTSAVASSSRISGELLYIVDSVSEKDNIVSMYLETREEERIPVRIILSDELTSEDIHRASSVAIRYTDEADDLIVEAFNDGKTVYLYGELTINEYKEYLGIDEYYVTQGVYDYHTHRKINSTAKTRLSDEQEDTDIFNVISCSKDDEMRLLSKILDGDKETPAYVYFRDIFEHNQCTKSSETNDRNAVIVDSDDYSFRTTYDGYDTSTFTSYILYQNTEEVVANKDYFVLSSLTYSVTDSIRVKEVGVIHEANYSNDRLLDWGPDNVSNATNISATIGFGDDSGLNGSVTINNLFDGRPEIDCTPDMANGDIEWALIADASLLFGEDLENQAFRCASSWSSEGSQISLKLKVRCISETLQQYVTQPWTSYNIVFNH